MVPCTHVLRAASALIGGLVVLAGCSETPNTRLASLNPYWRKQWQEDADYARAKNVQTYYDKLTEVQNVIASVPRLPPHEQERVAQQFCERCRTEANPHLKGMLIRSLGEFPSVTALATLQEVLQEEDPELRMAAVDALVKRKDASAVQLLATTIQQDESLEVRQAATRALGTFPNDPSVVQALGAALDDPNPALQYRAMLSLKEITHLDYGDSVAQWREYVANGEPFAPRQQSVAERIRSFF